MAGKKNGNRIKKDTKTRTSIINSDDEGSQGIHKNVQRRDNDEIDDFYEKKDKILLQGRSTDSDSEAEQVYGLSSEDDDDSDQDNELLNQDHANDMVARFVKKKAIDSDIEDEENDIPDGKAWGRKRQNFYDNDYNVKDTNGVTTSEQDRQVAKMEEEEALAIQKRLADEVDEDVFGLEDLQASTGEQENSTRIECIDIQKLPRKKLSRMVEEQSPELQGLIDDCRDKLRELDQEVAPILALYRSDKLPRGNSAENYFLLRHNLLLTYTSNVCFYLSLKAKRISVHNHPIIKRLGQFKRLITELDTTREKILPHTKLILAKARNGESFIRFGDINSQKQESSDDEQTEQASDEEGFDDEYRNEGLVLPKGRTKRIFDSVEQEIFALYDGIKTPKKLKAEAQLDTQELENNLAAVFQDDDSEQDGPVFLEGKAGNDEDESDLEESRTIESQVMERNENEDDDLGDDDGRRAINYQIAKNKGLTPKRKKEYRNPRVRHRMKYRKANIRRKGQVRAMRNETGNYGGEMSGINKQVVKSIKLK